MTQSVEHALNDTRELLMQLFPGVDKALFIMGDLRPSDPYVPRFRALNFYIDAVSISICGETESWFPGRT